MCYEFLVKPLIHFVNVILSFGKFHNIFKESTTLPLYKIEDKLKFSNSRHIAITNVISKLTNMYQNRSFNLYKQTQNYLQITVWIPKKFQLMMQSLT